MSLTIDSPAPTADADAPTAAPRRAGGPGLWVRVALAVVLLGASATVRLWQAWGVDQALREGRKSPFPLQGLPKDLGDWEGIDEELDPQIARATGCTDHVFRTYQNRKTGSRVGLILLYGPAEEMRIHAPDNCYPAAGYGYATELQRRTIESDGRAYPFKTTVYLKGEGGRTERQEVYWTWRYSGHWTPDQEVYKRMERIPGMYKVHVTRAVGENELREVGNPCESFLEVLMPWLSGRIAGASATPAAVAAR